MTSQLEQAVDKELGIEPNRLGNWEGVESFIDKELGIETQPEPTFEQQEERVRDILQISDDLELPRQKVMEEYDEIQRQKKEYPFGQLRAGKDEFSARKLFKNLWQKVKPPPLGEADASQIYHRLVDGIKGLGHVGTDYLSGRYTLGMADAVATPIDAFNKVYLANKKLKKDLESQGAAVKDIGQKHLPYWRVDFPDGTTEYITPNWVGDEEYASSVSELYDQLVGLNVPEEKKVIGELARTLGMFRAAAKLRGPIPKSVGPLGRAGVAGQIGLIYGTANEVRKGLQGDESYRGTVGVLQDAAVLAALSLIVSGVGGVWDKLRPTEQRQAMRLLGLREKDLAGLSETARDDVIRKAARKFQFKYHPDKTGTNALLDRFHKVTKARDILLNPDYGRDIVYRGSNPSTVKLLTGVTEEGIPIKPKKPVIKVEPSSPIVVTTPSEKGGEVVTGKTIKQTLYRGEQFEKHMPIDYGYWGKGKYWSTDKVEAERYAKGGNLIKEDIILQNPAVMTPEEANHIKDQISKESGYKLSLEEVAEEFGKRLQARGYDSFVLKGEKGDEVVVYPKPLPTEPQAKQAVEKQAELQTDEDFGKLADNIRPGFVDIEPYAEALKSVHDWMFTFGEAKRLNPELFDKLMKSYGERNAAVEKAIAILKRVVPENLTYEESMELALAYEDKRITPPEGLEETYKAFSDLLGKIEKRGIEEGIFAQPFQERMIAENEQKIEKIKSEVLHPNKSKRIQELVAENARLRQIRYLPHSIVARRTIENKLAELKGEERQAYLDSIARISAKYKKRTGKLFLKDYLEAGILKPEDIDIRNLTAHALTDYYYRSALKSLFDYASEQEMVKPASEALRKEGWLDQTEIGIISPELKGKVVHPLLASSLSEMKEMKLGKGGGLMRQTLGMVKIGQFIKPSIIWFYNIIQAYMKGIYNLDPVGSSNALAESFNAVLSKNALYHKLNESNLYQFPYEVSRGSIEEQIEQYIRQNSPEISRLTKLLEKTTDMTWKAEDLDIKKMIMVGHRALANLTWTGDKIQRTHSYLNLRKMGYPHDEAVKVAANSHGAYSALSEKYKKTLSPITFVYSFRVLMPIEIAKILTEPLLEIPQAFVKGEPIPKHKWNRWVKSWVGSVAIVVLTDQYLKMRGFEKEGKHLGPLAWKWKKTVEIDGKKQEIVVGINNILNMPVKYWNRITYYNPIRREARWHQALVNIIKWEVHPLWRIFFWDILQNRKSFGSGVEVYDPEDNPVKQLGQVLGYVFGQSFRFWGGVMDAVGEGNMTEKERANQEVIFNEGLNRLDRILFTVFGYKYVRANLQERKTIAGLSLKKEIARRIFRAKDKYSGDELKREKAEIEKWAKKCKDWIENDMK